MSDHDQTQPVRPGDPAPDPAPAQDASLPDAPAATPPGGTVAAEPTSTATGRRGFRERLGTWRRSDGDRTFGLAALIASALAGIIVGGLGFATFSAVSDDGDRGHDRGGIMQRQNPGGDRFSDRGGRR